MFNLHVIYALFVLCMFLLHDVLTFKWRRWWSLPLYLAVFIVAGLPGPHLETAKRRIGIDL